MTTAYPPTHPQGALPDTSSLNTSIIKVLAGAGMMVLSLWTTPAMAWGSQGHQVIAGLALSQLTPKARAEVDKLLALGPGETLVSVSTWADEHRSPATARWHYVNFPRDSCSYLPKRDCPDGQCVVAAIDRQAEVLKSDAPPEKRLNALKYLVHLVGDVYQPLHAGYLDDKGGNIYQLQAFMRGSNLHAFWDSGLIKNLDEDVEAMTTRLSKRQVAKPSSSWTSQSAAEASCKIVGTEGFYPARKMDVAYVTRYVPILEQRLVEAGSGLAWVLNSSLK